MTDFDDIPTVQSRAYCRPCASFHRTEDLRQTYRARDELACPDCYAVVPPQYQP